MKVLDFLQLYLLFFMSTLIKGSSNKALSPTEVVSLLQKTLQDHKSGKIYEAIEGYEQVIPLVTAPATLLSLHNNVGAIYHSTGKYELALKHFEASVELDSANAQSHFNLAVLLTSKLNQHGKAIKHCGLAIKIDPENFKYYHLMGNILQTLGKEKESEKYYQIADNLAKQQQQPSESVAAADNSNSPRPLLQNVVKRFSFPLTIGSHEITLDDLKTYSVNVESVSPLIITIDGFLTNEECEYIKEKSRDKLERSFIMGNSVRDITSDENEGELDEDNVYRSSYNTWLPLDEYLHSLQKRISKVLSLPVSYILSNSEDLQVVKYDLNGQFKLHQDSSAFHSRLMTILFYLNDVATNSESSPSNVCEGETWFPFASASLPAVCQSSSQQECVNLEANDKSSVSAITSIEKAILQGLNSYDQFTTRKDKKDSHPILPGLKVPPKKGKVVVFFNYRIDDDLLDPLAVHAGLPLRKPRAALEESNGREQQSTLEEKWVANYWIKFNREELTKL
jgi:hypothetical protein